MANIAQSFQNMLDGLQDTANGMQATAVAGNALLAAGGPGVAKQQTGLQQALQPLQQQLQAQQQQQQAQHQQLLQLLQQQGQQLHAVQQEVQGVQRSLWATHALAAKTHNRTCGDGIAAPYAPVPNAAGELSPAGLPVVADSNDMQNMTTAHALQWCNHYNVQPVPVAAAARRRAVASQLGLVMEAAWLE